MNDLGVNFILNHAAFDKSRVDDIVQILEMVGNNFFKIRKMNDFFGSNDFGKSFVVIVDNFLESSPGNTLLSVHI